MTAEIAILNRIGVALAADSAVTISSRQGDPKIYNSADKLFELEGGEPVGIMIHGSAEFMGIPAETIIKGFCASNYNTSQPELDGYVRQFLEFMRHELPIERTTMIGRLAGIAVDALVGIRSQAEAEYEELQAKGGRRPKPAVFMARKVQEIVATHLKALRRAPVVDNVDERHLPAEFDDIVGQAISTVLGDGMLAKIDAFSEMLRLIVLRQIDIGGEIGFVFAGFGTNQIFPAIRAIDCDLALVDALRVRERGSSQISNRQVAVIMPFAQSEMVERFMDGVDASYSGFIREALRAALTSFGNEVANRLGAGAAGGEKAVARELARLRDTFVEELEAAAGSFRAVTYQKKILDVVQFMPRSELAEMAESLVNLTSIKRRVSAEHESVGGPIDVAFVSKHDGFTWIRRKGAAAGPGEPGAAMRSGRPSWPN